MLSWTGREQLRAVLDSARGVEREEINGTEEQVELKLTCRVLDLGEWASHLDQRNRHRDDSVEYYLRISGFFVLSFFFRRGAERLRTLHFRYFGLMVRVPQL